MTARVLKIVYVGETWLGSSARSLRDALAVRPGVDIDDIGEDHYLPRHSTLLLRGANRLLRPLQRLEFEREVAARLTSVRPEVLMVYKGNGISARIVRQAKQAGIFTANISQTVHPMRMARCSARR